ncbi:hypothetical protein BD626DRAFT_62418 [Schizophyllum amplum]|uniref:Uncharacterized protein n=1 Tax=Schizophyllum amplum TaxID=97359 RepID=A0A550BSE1_9AGAR|nr:hypothetical protein BD626DRAFT_62418 [Auriculariopsis ampla]
MASRSGTQRSFPFSSLLLPSTMSLLVVLTHPEVLVSKQSRGTSSCWKQPASASKRVGEATRLARRDDGLGCAATRCVQSVLLRDRLLTFSSQGLGYGARAVREYRPRSESILTISTHFNPQIGESSPRGARAWAEHRQWVSPASGTDTCSPFPPLVRTPHARGEGRGRRKEEEKGREGRG